MYVRPLHARIVDPFRRDFLPPEGREVAPDPYWHRLAHHGDVAIGAPPAQPDPDPSTRAADASRAQEEG